MNAELYAQAHDAGAAPCPHLRERHIRWTELLPPPLQTLVVEPKRFDVHSDYEMRAEHTHGRDATNAPCYDAYRFVLTQLRSDDEMFYEIPIYAETLTAWRLLDARWLVCRTQRRLDCREPQTSYSISDVMPR